MGNILLTDEGLGSFAIHALRTHYHFSEKVTLLDGATMGVKLLNPISECDRLLVIDTLDLEGQPGEVKQIRYHDLKLSLQDKNSLHEVNFCETMVHAEMMGILPETTIIGLIPKSIAPWHVGLTSEAASQFDVVIETVLNQLQDWGEKYQLCGGNKQISLAGIVKEMTSIVQA